MTIDHSTMTKALGGNCHCSMVNCHLSLKGTLLLRPSLARLCGVGYRQLANGSGDLLAVLLAILNGYASASGQITVALGLRVQGEPLLFCLAANFLRNDNCVRVDRSDRSLGAMRRRLGYFRLGVGGRV